LKTDTPSELVQSSINPSIAKTSLLQYSVIAITQAIVVASGLFVYCAVDRLFHADGFSEYALSRRVTSLFVPIFSLGLSVGLSRQIAISAYDNNVSPASLLLSAVGLCVIPISFIVCISVLLCRTFSVLFFGSEAHSESIIAAAVMSAGSTLHLLCYAYFRGRMKFILASVFEVLTICVAPLMSLLFAKSASNILLLTGLFTIGICGVTTVIIGAGHFRGSLGLASRIAAPLLLYSVQRVPGDLVWACIFSVPALLAAHYLDVTDAGLIAFGNTMITLAATAVAPISVVILPQAARMIRGGDHKGLQTHVLRMLKIVILLSLSATTLAEISMDFLVMLYFGSPYERMAFVSRILVIAMPPCVVYVCLRSVVDAMFDRSINSINLLLSFVFIFVMAIMGQIVWPGLTCILMSFVLGIYLLGFMTWLQVRTAFSKFKA
jgi:O-antigen/teichoic acid export membrane protein